MSAGLLSMTGFGRGSALHGTRRLLVELRSLNARGFDVKVRGLKVDLAPALEMEVVAALRAAITRGTVSVTLREESGETADTLIDLAAVRRAHGVLETARRELGLAEPVDLATVAAFLAGPAAAHVRHDELTWEAVRPALEQAVGELQTARAREGAALSADLGRRLGRLSALANEIAGLAAGLPTRAARKLEERLAAVVGGNAAPVEPARLAQEVALLAEKLDVSEELVRLRTHLEHMGELIAGGAPEAPGRKIDFLVQEIARELNTVGSKVQDAPIVALVVESKAELEKLREQAQNIE